MQTLRISVLLTVCLLIRTVMVIVNLVVPVRQLIVVSECSLIYY